MIVTGFRVRKDDGTEEIVDLKMPETAKVKPSELPPDKVYWRSDGVLMNEGDFEVYKDDPQIFIVNKKAGSMGGIIRMIATMPDGTFKQAFAMQFGMEGFVPGTGTFGCCDLTVCSNGNENGATVGIVGGHDGVPPRILPGGPGWEVGSPDQPFASGYFQKIVTDKGEL